MPVRDDIGGRLREAREQRGLSLPDAARRTKLSIHVLQAIERNDFDSLPGGMFRKAYVRTLADEVGLNPDELAADYCARFEPSADPPSAPPPPFTLPVASIEPPSPAPLRTIIIATALAGGCYMLQRDPAAVVPVEDTTFEFVAARLPIDAAPLAAAVETQEYPLRIEMNITDLCWISAEADGQRIVYRPVDAGERIVVTAEQSISLRLGNAGGVNLSINGAPERSLGANGEVADLHVTVSNVERLLEEA